MALSASEQKDCAREWVKREFRDAGKTANLSVADIGAAATALHDTLTANQATLVASLPEPFKTTSTAAQKRLLLAAVAMKMAGMI